MVGSPGNSALIVTEGRGTRRKGRKKQNGEGSVRDGRGIKLKFCSLVHLLFYWSLLFAHPSVNPSITTTLHPSISFITICVYNIQYINI